VKPLFAILGGGLPFRLFPFAKDRAFQERTRRRGRFPKNRTAILRLHHALSQVERSSPLLNRATRSISRPCALLCELALTPGDHGFIRANVNRTTVHGLNICVKQDLILLSVVFEESGIVR
jgi:hypothetical protein